MDMVGVRKVYMSAKRQTYSSPCSLWDCICSGNWHMLFLGSLYRFKEKFLRWELFIRELMDNENPIPFPPYSLCIFLFNINVDPKVCTSPWHYLTMFIPAHPNPGLINLFASISSLKTCSISIHYT